MQNIAVISSWRHTPFRNLTTFVTAGAISSWRHMPFRKPISTAK
ncbi:hypothetical protein J542_0826 [Acinetobacter baumannii 299505]|nr:hypothetical protein J542_0826 [Acinetobacter baumannii 299505]